MQTNPKAIRSIMLLMVIVVAGLASVPALSAKDYYKWTDDEGVTHYSARKPHNRDAEAISIATGQRSEAAANSSNKNEQPRQTQTEPKTTQTANAEGPADPERCEAARSNLEVLRNNAKVRMKDENGEIHYLSEEEKAEKSREFQQAIDESC